MQQIRGHKIMRNTKLEARKVASHLKMKRKFGFLKRIKTVNGRLMLARKMLKGRWRLSA